MRQSKDTMILLVVLMLLLIAAGVIVFSGFFEDDPGSREKIKVINEGEQKVKQKVALLFCHFLFCSGKIIL